MTEEIKQSDNGQIKPEEKKEEINEFRLTITKNLQNNQLSVQGPGNGQMYDKWVCFGLMEDARDFIKTHNAEVNADKIVKSRSPSMAQQIRGMFRHK